MRKIFTAIVLIVASFANAQDSHTISLFGSATEPSLFGLSIESDFNETTGTGKNKKLTYLVNVSASSLTDDNTAIDGNGFQFDLGTRRYFKNELKGIYVEGFLTYGQVKFDDTFLGFDVDGKYSYWSLINNNIGYRINLGNFVIDPSLGFMWKWEVKGKGIIDNKDYDNLVFRAGLKVGYKF